MNRTASLAIDHRFTFRISSFLHWTGVLLMLAGVLWWHLCAEGTDTNHPVWLCVSGAGVFAAAWSLSWGHVSSRCARAYREPRAVPLAICRMHRIPAGHEGDHIAGADCPCHPEEIKPSLFIHYTGNIPPSEWVNVKEYHHP